MIILGIYCQPVEKGMHDNLWSREKKNLKLNFAIFIVTKEDRCELLRSGAGKQIGFKMRTLNKHAIQVEGRKIPV